MYFIGTCSTTPAANATTVEVLVNISQADVDVVPVTFQVNVAPLYAYSNLNQLLYSL